MQRTFQAVQNHLVLYKLKFCAVHFDPLIRLYNLIDGFQYSLNIDTVGDNLIIVAIKHHSPRSRSSGIFLGPLSGSYVKTTSFYSMDWL